MIVPLHVPYVPLHVPLHVPYVPLHVPLHVPYVQRLACKGRKDGTCIYMCMYSYM